MTDKVEYVVGTVLFSDGCVCNTPRLRLIPFCTPADIHARVQMTDKDFTGGAILHYDGSVVTEEFIKAGFYIYLLSEFDTKKYRRKFNRIMRRWTNLKRVEIANDSYFGSQQHIGPCPNGTFSENSYNTSFCSLNEKTEEGATIFGTCKLKRVRFKDDLS